MFEVGVVVSFTATHRLEGDFGPARRKHGHNYRVVVTVQGNELRDDGTLCNITILDRASREAVGGLHRRNLSEMPEFQGRNTTAEEVAGYLFLKIAPGLGGNGLSSLAVRVWESPHAYASYEGSLG